MWPTVKINVFAYESTRYPVASKIKCIVQSLNLKSLQTRKKAKKHHIVGIEISINDNTESLEICILPEFENMSEICCVIYRPNSNKLLTREDDWKSTSEN